MTTIIEQTNHEDVSKYRHWSICCTGPNTFFIQHHETQKKLYGSNIRYKRLGVEGVIPAGVVLQFFRKNQKLAGATAMEKAFRAWLDKCLKDVPIPMDVEQ